MEDAIQQFRITPWPNRLPHPPLRDWWRYSLDSGGLLYFDPPLDLDEAASEEWRAEQEHLRRRPSAGTRSPSAVAATGEIYLELVRVDLDDDEAVLSFVDRFEILGTGYANYGLFRELPGFIEQVLPELEESWRHRHGTPWADQSGRYRGRTMAETLTEFRFGARCFRDLVRAWEVVRAGTLLTDEVIGWESIPPGFSHLPNLEGVTVVGDPVGIDPFLAVWGFLKTMLEAGLLPLHPRLLSPGEPSSPEDVFSRVPLYSVCCLELFNHIAEHATYRQCANQTCGRTFVRQSGRAVAGQHRTEGVKYCSSHCARAQAQRDHRARRKRRSTSDSDD